MSLLLLFCCLAQGGETASLRGRVDDAAGAAIAGATVALKSPGAMPIIANTNDEGRFHFSGLAPGIYDLEADAQGFRKENRKGIKLSAGGSVELPTITLEVGDTGGCDSSPLPLPFVEQTPLDSSGTRVTGYLYGLSPGRDGGLVTLTNVRFPWRVFRALTDSDGRFVFQEVPPGSYRLRASKSGYTSFMIDETPIRVSRGQETTIEPLPMNDCLGKRPCPVLRHTGQPVICM